MIEIIKSPLGYVRRMTGATLGKWLLIRSGVIFGEGLLMTSMPICRRHPGARIQLGDNVIIRNTIHENLAGITHRTVLAAITPGAEIRIGNNVGISGAILYCVTMITIEGNVNIGAGAKIYDTDFHPIDAMARRIHDVAKIKSAPVLVCEDAWLGAECVVLKGVTIGARSIVAARAVVTRDVPPDCIVAGVPAETVAYLH